MMSRLMFVFLLLQPCNCDNNNNNNNDDNNNNINLSDVLVETSQPSTSPDAPVMEAFIPTTEWQVIKPGQAVPRGLHYRMNFQTGVQEAKLLQDENVDKKATHSNKVAEQSNIETVPAPSCEEESGEKNKYTKDGASSSCPKKEKPTVKVPKIILSEESEPEERSDDKIYLTKNQLKDALNDFRDKVGTTPVDDVTWSNDAKAAMDEQLSNEQRVKKKFRTMEEIRTELEDSMNMHVKTDVEVMKEFVRYIVDGNSTTDDKLSSVDSLEYYVHQIDNAMDLDKIGGLEPIVNLLNSTEESLQEKAANLLAAACQNNAAVKHLVFGYGGLRLLLQMTHGEKKTSTKKKALYALSTLLRDNPQALQDLSDSHSLRSIIHMIKDASLPTSLQVKAIDLLFTLIADQNQSRKRLQNNGIVAVPEHTHLDQLLMEHNLCDILVPLLKSEDFYMKEKVLHAIEVSTDICKDVLMRADQAKGLYEELDKLEEIIKNEDDEDFKSYLQTMRNEFKENVIDKLK